MVLIGDDGEAAAEVVVEHLTEFIEAVEEQLEDHEILPPAGDGCD